MQKWQELCFNFLFNLSVAVLAGGVLNIALGKGSIVASVLLITIGAYIAIAAMLLSRSYDIRK